MSLRYCRRKVAPDTATGKRYDLRLRRWGYPNNLIKERQIYRAYLPPRLCRIWLAGLICRRRACRGGREVVNGEEDKGRENAKQMESEGQAFIHLNDSRCFPSISAGCRRPAPLSGANGKYAFLWYGWLRRRCIPRHFQANLLYWPRRVGFGTNT